MMSSGGMTAAQEKIIRDAAMAVVNSVLKLDEIDELAFVGSSNSLTLSILAKGERASFVLTGGDVDVFGQYEHFVDGLENFVAESRFAWGERRVVPEHLVRLPIDFSIHEPSP